MSDAYLKNVVEAALLAAARPVSVSELLQVFDEQSRPQREGDARAARAAGRRLRGPRRHHQGDRQRLPLPGAQRVRAGSVAAVAGSPAQVFARIARDPGAHRLPPADHARRNRKRARRRGESGNRQDTHGAQLGARRRSPRRARVIPSCSAPRPSSSITSRSSPSKTCRRSPNIKSLSDLNLQLPLPVTARPSSGSGEATVRDRNVPMRGEVARGARDRGQRRQARCRGG